MDRAAVRYFILDEADEMLNIGFKEAVDQIFETIAKDKADSAVSLQTMLFSATVPTWVSDMIKKYFRQGHVSVDLISGNQGSETASKIQHLQMPCPWSNRAKCIGDIVLCYAGTHGKTIIFTETKKEANELALDDAIKQVVPHSLGILSPRC